MGKKVSVQTAELQEKDKGSVVKYTCLRVNFAF